MADLETRGIPTVGVATTEFIEGAAAGAKSLGIDPALVFVPLPVQDRTDDELKKLRFFADRAAKKWPLRGSLKYAGVLLAYPP